MGRRDEGSEAPYGWNSCSTEAKKTYARDHIYMISAYANTRKELMAAMKSTSFTTLERFRQRKMVPGEALLVFLHDLKQLLEQAMPGLDSADKEQLLLHQFVAGLPQQTVTSNGEYH